MFVYVVSRTCVYYLSALIVMCIYLSINIIIHVFVYYCLSAVIVMYIIIIIIIIIIIRIIIRDKNLYTTTNKCSQCLTKITHAVF